LINPRVALRTGTGWLTKWDAQVRAGLEKQFPDAPHFRNSILTLWEKYCNLGLPNAHFVSELSSGKNEVTPQRVWEMMLARHLDALGYRVGTQPPIHINPSLPTVIGSHAVESGDHAGASV
jgi:hypothetical protein